MFLKAFARLRVTTATSSTGPAAASLTWPATRSKRRTAQHLSIWTLCCRIALRNIGISGEKELRDAYMVR